MDIHKDLRHDGQKSNQNCGPELGLNSELKLQDIQARMKKQGCVGCVLLCPGGPPIKEN